MVGKVAHKTITISQEAYNALKAMKNEHESFTQVILKITGKKKPKLSQILPHIVWNGPHEELDDLEDEIRLNRRKQILREVEP